MCQVTSDQAGHLDSHGWGFFALYNFMFGPSAVGIFLDSGGAIHRAKLLEEEEYGRFCEELPLIPSAIYPGKRMVDGMRGTPAHKRKVAWRHYLGAKLRSEGFGSLWQRKYLVLEEFYAYIGSFAELHFGARFPLRFRNLQSVPNDLWHLRGHLYVARARALDRTGRQNFVPLKPEVSTINIFNCDREALEAVTQFFDSRFALDPAVTTSPTDSDAQEPGSD